MTSPMDLPLFGKVKLFETSKSELLDLWQTVLKKNNITVKENSKVESIISEDGIFKVTTLKGEQFTAAQDFTCNRQKGNTPQTEYPW